MQKNTSGKKEGGFAEILEGEIRGHGLRGGQIVAAN